MLGNRVLAETLDLAMRSVEQEPWTQEETEFAKKLNRLSERQWNQALRDNGLPGDTELYTGCLLYTSRCV